MKSARILVVEDEPILATDISEDVEELGYDVVSVVHSGEEAVEAVEEHRPDLVLMDIRLAGKLDGIEAAAQIKEEFNTSVVYLTAHSDEATLQRAKITEPYGYLLKPFEQIELRIALEIALHKQLLEKAGKTEQSIADKAPSSGEIEKLQSKESSGKADIEIVNFMKQIKPFNLVPEDKLITLASHSRFCKYNQGDFIILEGDDVEHSGFIVFSGRVAMIKSSASGRDLIVELLPVGDPFGLVTAVQKEAYPFTARAQVETELIHVPRQAFFGLLKEIPELYRGIIEEMNARLHAAHDISRALAHDRVEVRVASALARLSSDFNSGDKESGEPEIHITRQELADLTGTTVETAIRTTRSFEKDGVIDLSEVGVIRLRDEDELLRIAQE